MALGDPRFWQVLDMIQREREEGRKEGGKWKKRDRNVSTRKWSNIRTGCFLEWSSLPFQSSVSLGSRTHCAHGEISSNVLIMCILIWCSVDVGSRASNTLALLEQEEPPVEISLLLSRWSNSYNCLGGLGCAFPREGANSCASLSFSLSIK